MLDRVFKRTRWVIKSYKSETNQKDQRVYFTISLFSNMLVRGQDVKRAFLKVLGVFIKINNDYVWRIFVYFTIKNNSVFFIQVILATIFDHM